MPSTKPRLSNPVTQSSSGDSFPPSNLEPIYFKVAKPYVVGLKDPISKGLNSKTVDFSETISSPGERSSATIIGIGALPEEKLLSF